MLMKKKTLKLNSESNLNPEVNLPLGKILKLL